MPNRTMFWTLWGTAAVLVLIFLRVGVDLYTNSLWFLSLGYGSVYWTLIKAKSSAFMTFWAMFVLIAGVNVGMARIYGRRTRRTALGVIIIDTFPGLLWRLRHPWVGWGGVILALGALMGLVSVQMWPAWIRYDHPILFGAADPLFGQDVGYYVFSLPLINFLQGWLVAALLLSAFLTAVSYYLDRSLVRQDTRWEMQAQHAHRPPHPGHTFPQRWQCRIGCPLADEHRLGELSVVLAIKGCPICCRHIEMFRAQTQGDTELIQHRQWQDPGQQEAEPRVHDGCRASYQPQIGTDGENMAQREG